MKKAPTTCKMMQSQRSLSLNLQIFLVSIPKREKRGYPYPGSNHRMTEFQAAEASFSKARLKEYRRSLRFPVMDNTPPTDKEMLSVDSKIALLGSRKDMEGIVEAFAKVAKNTDKLA